MRERNRESSKRERVETPSRSSRISQTPSWFFPPSIFDWFFDSPRPQYRRTIIHSIEEVDIRTPSHGPSTYPSYISIVDDEEIPQESPEQSDEEGEGFEFDFKTKKWKKKEEEISTMRIVEVIEIYDD